jgi:DNA-binding NarL/FixJ family response regulator
VSTPGGTTAEGPTVFLVDDHEVVRAGLRTMFEIAGVRVVGEASGAQEALRRIPAARPDVVILDLMLPDGDGVSVCRDVRAALPDTAVLILSSHDDDEAMFAAIVAGAAGYVLKQVRGNELIEGVRRVAQGESLLDPAVTGAVLKRLRPGTAPTGPLETLTDQERRVLELIAEGLTNRQIGARLDVAEKTVKNHVTSLLAKLGLASRTQAAVFVTTETRGRPQ